MQELRVCKIFFHCIYPFSHETKLLFELIVTQIILCHWFFHYSDSFSVREDSTLENRNGGMHFFFCFIFPLTLQAGVVTCTALPWLSPFSPSFQRSWICSLVQTHPHVCNPKTGGVSNMWLLEPTFAVVCWKYTKRNGKSLLLLLCHIPLILFYPTLSICNRDQMYIHMSWTKWVFNRSFTPKQSYECHIEFVSLDHHL